MTKINDHLIIRFYNSTLNTLLILMIMYIISQINHFLSAAQLFHVRRFYLIT